MKFLMFFDVFGENVFGTLSSSSCSISMPLHFHSTLEPLGIQVHLDTHGIKRSIPPSEASMASFQCIEVLE